MERANTNTKKDVNHSILFAIGKDRSGIVHEVSEFLTSHGANIKDSRMAAMGGHFSMTVLFQLDDAKMESIVNNSEELSEIGLNYYFYEATETAEFDPFTHEKIILEVEGMDHTGIVRNVVQILRKHAIDIETLDTKMNRAPFSGTPIFRMLLEGSLPKTTSIRVLKERLEDIAIREDLDITLSAIESDEGDEEPEPEVVWVC